MRMMCCTQLENWRLWMWLSLISHYVAISHRNWRAGHSWIKLISDCGMFRLRHMLWDSCACSGLVLSPIITLLWRPAQLWEGKGRAQKWGAPPPWQLHLSAGVKQLLLAALVSARIHVNDTSTPCKSPLCWPRRAITWKPDVQTQSRHRPIGISAA